MTMIVQLPTAITPPLAPANTYPLVRQIAMMVYVVQLIRTIPPLANANIHPYHHPIAMITIVILPMCTTLLHAPASIIQ